MKVDEVVVVPPGTDWMDSARELLTRADEFAEKYKFHPPVATRLLDGHGNQIVAAKVNWDQDRNLLPEQEEPVWSIPVPIADGLFFVMEDAHGKTAVVKLQIEGQEIN